MSALYDWILPSPSSPGGGGYIPGPSFGTSGEAAKAGALDLYVDPETGDFADDNAGGWVEVSDASGMVRAQLDEGPWWADRDNGSRHGEIQRDPDLGGDPEMAAAMTAALQALESEGLVRNARVTPRDRTDEEDALGRSTFDVSYNDQISGEAVDVVYRPFGEG